MTMKLNILAAAVALAAWPASLLAQDQVIFKDPAKGAKGGVINSINYKEIQFESSDNPGIAVTISAREIAELRFDMHNKSYDLASGVDLMMKGDFAAAIDKLLKAKNDSRIEKPLADYVRINIAKCYFNAGNYDKAIDAAKSLRGESKDSFYTEDSFELQYQAARAKGDVRAAESAISEYSAAGASMAVKEWQDSADLKRGELAEAKGDFRAAAAVYAKFAGAKDQTGINAKLGQLRCFEALADWNQLKAASEGIIGSLSGKDLAPAQVQLLMGAYNGRGACLLNEKKNKDALLELMRSVDVLSPRYGDQCPEHQAALAKAAVACARLVADQAKDEDKARYRQRANELLAELVKKYGESGLAKMVKDEIQKVK